MRKLQKNHKPLAIFMDHSKFIATVYANCQKVTAFWAESAEECVWQTISTINGF
jgi:hypothetical protein